VERHRPPGQVVGQPPSQVCLGFLDDVRRVDPGGGPRVKVVGDEGGQGRAMAGEELVDGGRISPSGPVEEGAGGGRVGPGQGGGEVHIR
jgi:hypothetical protein